MPHKPKHKKPRSFLEGVESYFENDPVQQALRLPSAVLELNRETKRQLESAAKPALSPAQLKARRDPEEQARMDDMSRRFRESRRPIDPYSALPLTTDPFTGEPVEPVEPVELRGQEPPKNGTPMPMTTPPVAPLSPEQSRQTLDAAQRQMMRAVPEALGFERDVSPLPQGEGFTDPTLLPDKKATLRGERRKQKRQQRRRRK